MQIDVAHKQQPNNPTIQQHNNTTTRTTQQEQNNKELNKITKNKKQQRTKNFAPLKNFIT